MFLNLALEFVGAMGVLVYPNPQPFTHRPALRMFWRSVLDKLDALVWVVR